MPKKRAKKRIPRLKMKENMTFLKVIATRLFGKLTDKKFMKYFSNLKEPFNSARMDMMFRTYLAVMFLIAAMTFCSALLFTAIIMLFLKVTLLYFIAGLIIFPSLMAAFIFMYMYMYPQAKSARAARSIESNLPFAINHMAAVAESGATPYSMFKVLAKFKEYGEVSEEADMIVRNVDFFGLDIISALRETVLRSPSKEFRKFLESISTTIQTGGELNKYLKEEAREAMFNYRMNRDKYTQMISIYADFYTALLIAAPLIMIAILSVLGMIGGSVFGLPIDLVIKLGVYVLIPLLNVIFLMFLQMTQPAV